MGEYLCDMPGDSLDGTCGKLAVGFFDGGGYHRPVCGVHGLAIHPILFIDAVKVPGQQRKVLDPKDAVNAPKGVQFTAQEQEALRYLLEPQPKPHDPVNHPSHYTSHPSGVECITIAEHFNFNLGNALKYLWRAGLKNGLEDLKKARWYLDREISRLETKNG